MSLEVVTVSVDDLKVMIREVVAGELERLEKQGEIMDKKQLREYTGWSYTTIWRKMQNGLPFTGSNREHPIFLRSRVNQWLTENETRL
jgi:hypothetical protein